MGSVQVYFFGLRTDVKRWKPDRVWIGAWNVLFVTEIIWWQTLLFGWREGTTGNTYVFAGYLRCGCQQNKYAT